MFSTPIFAPRSQAQENKDIMARKPGISNSGRKPLADKSINQSASAKNLNLLKPIVPKVNRSKSVSSEVCLDVKNSDVCSFKDNQDLSKDIKPKGRLNTTDFFNFLNPVTNPSPKLDNDFMAMVSEIPKIEKIPDWYGDTCSYDIKEDYEDIWNKFEGSDTINDFLNSLKPPKTPPPKLDSRFEPTILEIPQHVDYDFDDVIETPAENVTFPDFDSFIL